MSLTNFKTQLLILIVSIVATFYFYPEFFYILSPLYIAISFYYTLNENISSIFPINISNFIINNKKYIMCVLVLLSIYNYYMLYNSVDQIKDLTTPSVSTITNSNASNGNSGNSSNSSNSISDNFKELPLDLSSINSSF